jgi:hypothetical protein
MVTGNALYSYAAIVLVCNSGRDGMDIKVSEGVFVYIAVT